MDDIAHIAIHHYFTYILNPRSISDSDLNLCEIIKNDADTIKETNKLEEIIGIIIKKDKNNPVQGTPEWHTIRNNMITASNAYKIFGTESQRNQLIYEKCKIKDNQCNDNNVNMPFAFEWGHKYEPISKQLYELMYNTTVSEFGCIPHSDYSFIGASPDGINTDVNNPRFGRMLEIKNVVSRQITGIPKKEYWVQVQLQLEVCDLDECDFLETKFVEYDSYREFIEDGTIRKSTTGCEKGIIICFLSENGGRKKYSYMPLEITTDELLQDWIRSEMDANEQLGYTWLQNYYWKLDIFSCVLILRNREWFRQNVTNMVNIWDIILNERLSGFAHRAPNQISKRKNTALPPKNLFKFVKI